MSQEHIEEIFSLLEIVERESSKKDQIIKNLQDKLEEYASELSEREYDIRELNSKMSRLERDNAMLAEANRGLVSKQTEFRATCAPGFGIDMSRPRTKYAHVDEDTSFSSIRTAITAYDDHNWG